MNRVVFVDTRFYKDLTFLDKINLKEGDYAFIPLLNSDNFVEFTDFDRSYEIGFCCQEELDNEDFFINNAVYSLLRKFYNVYCRIEIITPDRALLEAIEDVDLRFPARASLHWVNIPVKKKEANPQGVKVKVERREADTKMGEAKTERREVKLDRSGITFNPVNDFNYNLTKLKSQYGVVTQSDFEKYVYHSAMNFIKNKDLKEFYDLIGLVSNKVVSVELLEDFLKTIYDCHGELLFSLIKLEYVNLLKLICFNQIIY